MTVYTIHALFCVPDGLQVCWEDGSGKTIEVDSSEYEVQGEFVKLLRDLD
jgi:hypothetical protein